MPYNPQPDLDYASMCDDNAQLAEADGDFDKAKVYHQFAALNREYARVHSDSDKEAQNRVDEKIHRFRLQHRESGVLKIAPVAKPEPSPPPPAPVEPKRNWFTRLMGA